MVPLSNHLACTLNHPNSHSALPHRFSYMCFACDTAQSVVDGSRSRDMPTAEGKMDFGSRQMNVDLIISKLRQFLIVARQVPALWYLCALFGTAVTAILAVVILWLANWWRLAGVICWLIALGALGASLAWRARLEDSERIWKEGWNLPHRQRWYLHQGYRFQSSWLPFLRGSIYQHR